MLQDIAPASVGRGRTTGGSFTARAFAVNLGHEQADIHDEHNVLSRLTALWKMRFKQFGPTLARRQVDSGVNISSRSLLQNAK
ncbi:hypothetical protein RAD15_09580 [Bradyrhizobium sp. 14AA]